MPSNNSKYSLEFRDQTAEHVLKSGKSATSMAKDLGIDANTACRWVRDYQKSMAFPVIMKSAGDEGQQIRLFVKRMNLRSLSETKTLKNSSAPRKNKSLTQKRKRQQDNAKKQIEQDALALKVREVFDEHRQVVGYRSMQRLLANKDINLSEYMVRKIMKENGMYPKSYKKFKPMGLKK